jgi:putative endonuclease
MIKFIVYVLFSFDHDRIYIGQTSDIVKRIKEHNDSETKSTKAYRPWVLVHTEQYSTRAEAMRREKQLKSQKGREYIWNLINKEK